MVDINRLHQLLHYDQSTGLLFNKVSRRGVRAGTRAGHSHSSGYRRVWIDGVQYQEHRVVVAMMLGYWPDEIDHRNGDGHDNRWLNLRICSSSQNKMNQKVPSTSSSGIKGVSLYARTQRWSAYIKIGGVRRHLGYFGTKEEAVAARREEELRLFGEFSYLRRQG